ncbi:MAG: nicotinate-nucleotide--dimethylbenzimidazole phosphoribosyltransferase, partial [Treponema sp.]|nr:nicotinate-nucleotide--dimethylbenzimidazole phosphoribosyltransferase [Treponema sp.]
RLRNPDAQDAVDVVAKVGGFDIATMCGFFLGAKKIGVPCIIDGFISSVAALCAERIEPGAKSAFLASHLSGERAGKLVLDALSLSPVVAAGMHLGEGTGCMTLLPLLDMALEVFYTMPTFDEIHIDAYKPF